MIKADHLTKTYGSITALDDVNVSVSPGEVIGLLGPNGAGKTTLIKILAGYLHPDVGTVRIKNLDIVQEPARVQEFTGYLPENAPLYSELRVQDCLRLIAELRGIPSGQQDKYISDAVLAAGLEGRLAQRVGTLSKGYRQRLGLAQAILHKPQLLILDEPTIGLDPTQIVEVRRLIRNLARKTTVLISSHILSEIEATCDRAVIIMGGKVKADADLKELALTTNVLVSLQTKDENTALKNLTALPGVREACITERDNDIISYLVKGEKDRDLRPDIYRDVKKNNYLLYELHKETRNLETVFNELAGEG
ncbi:MAG: ABC transporter ATP-binding protein [Desulfobia sp.]